MTGRIELEADLVNAFGPEWAKAKIRAAGLVSWRIVEERYSLQGRMLVIEGELMSCFEPVED